MEDIMWRLRKIFVLMKAFFSSEYFQACKDFAYLICVVILQTLLLEIFELPGPVTFPMERSIGNGFLLGFSKEY